MKKMKGSKLLMSLNTSVFLRHICWTRKCNNEKIKNLSCDVAVVSHDKKVVFVHVQLKWKICLFNTFNSIIVVYLWLIFIGDHPISPFFLKHASTLLLDSDQDFLHLEK